MTRLTITSRAGLAVAVAGATVLLAAAPAYAADAALNVSGTTIYYAAAVGQTNVLTISHGPAVAEIYEFNDQVTITSTHPACYYPDAADPTRMACVVAAAAGIHVNVGDGNDTVTNLTNRGAFVTGGAGNDTIALGGRVGAPGGANGGDGNDLIRSGYTNDAIAGGAGTDTVSYAGGDDAVSVYLAIGIGGRSYEDDTYTGIENVTGGGGDDQIHGDGNANTLDGGTGFCPVRGCVGPSGDDRLYGYGGHDAFTGRDGVDVVYGGDGNDLALGGTMTDHLYGEAGNDLLNGEADTDVLDGGPGTDTCSADWQVECEVNW